MSQNKIYVGNLAYTTDEETIREAFGAFGQIESVALIKDRETGRPKGFGFITFDSDQAAQDALELNGKELDGRSIKVNIAKERESRSGGGGGGRGRGSNNRGNDNYNSRW